MGVLGLMVPLGVGYLVIVIVFHGTGPLYYLTAPIGLAATALLSRGQLLWRVAGGVWSWFTALGLGLYYA